MDPLPHKYQPQSNKRLPTFSLSNISLNIGYKENSCVSDSPDNLYGGEYYAIMDTEVEGKWRDVRNRGGEYPFVCKQYQTTCPRYGYYDLT